MQRVIALQRSGYWATVRLQSY